jgi:ATP-dependent RNA helicase DeaD
MTLSADPNRTSPFAAIHPALASALTAKGYHQLTPVQLAMTNEDHGEADLLVSAQTGSGKTVAFGIAIASTLLGTAERFDAAAAPLGLIIAPTRELAVQVQRELDWLYAAAQVRIATCVGGMDMRTERRALGRGAHLVVGTPGRLRDHITRGALDLSAIRAVVLDEADEMLDLGFRADLEFILAAAPQERRTLLFSATVRRGIAELARTVQTDAVRVETVASTEQHADIEYQLMLVRRDEREHAIINALLDSDSTSALVFCHTREAVRHLTARLANRGFSVVSLSGEMAQSERSNALQSMRDGRAHVCVATDVAARGIDLPSLDLVVHADVPSNPETLLHRSGRTGRAGRKGVCVLIVPEHRRGAARRVLALAKLTATVRAAPGIAEIEARYRRQILDAAVSAAEPDETEADFVAELLERAGPQRIAAAFLRQQMAAHPVPEELWPLPAEALQHRGSEARPPVRRGPAKGARAAPGHAGRRLVHHLARAQAARRSEIPVADDLQRRRRDQARCRRDQDRRHRNPLRDFRRQGRRLCRADPAARQPRERHHDRAGRRGGRSGGARKTERRESEIRKGRQAGRQNGRQAPGPGGRSRQAAETQEA